MFTAEKINKQGKEYQPGSALVIALIVLVILAALGYAGLEVADMNIFSSANDRDSKIAFLHADSGANVGHEFLEEAIADTNTTFYGGDTAWVDAPYDPTAVNNPEFLHIYVNGTEGTYVRAGQTGTEANPGTSQEMAMAYHGNPPGASFIFLIRSHRTGKRNSNAEVDMGWRHVSN